MADAFLSHVSDTLSQIKAEGLYKTERMITSPQGGEITVGDRQVINLCANNYLGLADHPALIDAATNTLSFDVADDEVERRRSAWQAPPFKASRGTLYKYIKNVKSASSELETGRGGSRPSGARSGP